ncbi:MAG: hypothetical protein R3B06_20455 [Kofleriaceae bacterium]
MTLVVVAAARELVDTDVRELFEQAAVLVACDDPLDGTRRTDSVLPRAAA